MSESMKAVRFHEYGGPEVLRYEDAPRPVAGREEVLVRVVAAGVNPMDWKVREGYFKSFLQHRLPLVPGWDMSGIVEATGPEAQRFTVGDEVYGKPDSARDGAYAEYIVVKEAELGPKPRSIDHVHAAGVALAGLTAWQALFQVGELTGGQKVLIHGAAGGVGIFAAQFARSKGAYVIGTASSRNQEFLRSIGVNEAIDYTTTRFDEAVRNVDLVFDTIGGETEERSWKVLKKGGLLVSIVAHPSGEKALAHGVRQAAVFTQSDPRHLKEITALIDAGNVKPVVETALPLSEARRAQELSQTGHTRGKIILSVG
jgi:NADPH:quinone reductase-like Zn-dependent oxidoreductase